MENQEMIDRLDEKITGLRQAAQDVMAICGSNEAVRRNIIKIMANIKMLELNISDIKDLAEVS